MVSPIKRSSYQPPPYAVDTVSLVVAIYDDHAVVHARLGVRSLTDAQVPLILNGAGGAVLDALSVDGKQVDVEALNPSSGRIAVPIGIACGKEAVVETVTTINPYENTALEGLYLSGDMLCSQCEPEGFRHITWHPDRPDVLGVYTTRIEAPSRYPILLANGNLIDEGRLEGDRHYAVWHDPHPKPSYLFAMVAGDLEQVSGHFKTMDGREVTLKIYVEAGNTHRTHHAMQSLKRAMAWDEKAYGFIYDLDIFMIVAVSHFNMGAMENKGLNIFNSKFILADDETASDADLERVEGIIAHEYFHNWTGNRITCRDWFQLTLKEGLTVYRDQEYTADTYSRGVKRTDDVALLRAIQFPEDNGPTAHPIRPEEYSEINNFYTPTVYEKGAEVIRMLATLLGHEGFMKGMGLYVERHDGEAVTCEDFIAAMANANDTNLDVFSRWYSQAGTPQIEITRAYDAKTQQLTLTMHQHLKPSAAATPRLPLVIPVRLGLVGADGKDVAFRLGDGGEVTYEATLIIDKAEAVFTLSDVPIEAVPSYLRGFSAPVILSTDLDGDDYRHLLAGDKDVFGRWDASQILMTEIVRLSVESASDEAIQSQISTLAQGFIDVLGDKRLDATEKAQMLRPPPQSVLETVIARPDPLAIWHARRQLMVGLGKRLGNTITPLLKIFEDKAFEGGAFEGGAFEEGDNLDRHERALAVRLLGLAVLGEGLEGDKAAQAKRFAVHRNMTLAEGALMALNQTEHGSIGGEIRAQALGDFVAKWADNSLVIEKWFALEASAPFVSTPEHCERLMQNPAFDARNPNKLRSVLGVFGAVNTPHFHADDGSGYDFLARHIIQIDSLNPQVATRLVLPLSRFAPYSQDRQDMMKAALLRIKDAGNISNDLLEIVGKALN